MIQAIQRHIVIRHQHMLSCWDLPPSSLYSKYETCLIWPLRMEMGWKQQASTAHLFQCDICVWLTEMNSGVISCAGIVLDQHRHFGGAHRKIIILPLNTSCVKFTRNTNPCMLGESLTFVWAIHHPSLLHVSCSLYDLTFFFSSMTFVSKMICKKAKQGQREMTHENQKKKKMHCDLRQCYSFTPFGETRRLFFSISLLHWGVKRVRDCTDTCRIKLKERVRTLQWRCYKDWSN